MASKAVNSFSFLESEFIKGNWPFKLATSEEERRNSEQTCVRIAERKKKKNDCSILNTAVSADISELVIVSAADCFYTD